MRVILTERSPLSAEVTAAINPENTNTHQIVMNEGDVEDHGFPVYLDSMERSLVDAASGLSDPKEWHPMNGAADRLVKCREALRDIEEVIETFASARAATKKRRRLRAIFVPLHSLCVNVVELINQIQADKKVHDRLPSNAPMELTKLRSHFIDLLPFHRKGKLGMLRNRVSAHYESSMSPAEMRELLNTTDSTEVGEWIHVTIGVLCDLLKLDAYMWTAEGPTEDTITMLCQEPLISVSRVEESKIVELQALYMCGKSPRMIMFDQMRELVGLSQCLFERKCHYRISSFYEDAGPHWARSLHPRDRE